MEEAIENILKLANSNIDELLKKNDKYFLREYIGEKYIDEIISQVEKDLNISFKYKPEDLDVFHDEYDIELYQHPIIEEDYKNYVECATTVGRRYNENQDSYSVNMINRNFEISDDILTVGVYDGHSEKGKQASLYISKLLPQLFENNVSKFDELDEKIISQCIEASFNQLNEKLESNDIFDYTGSTVCFCVLFEKFIVCANMGDTEALLVTDKITLPLSTLHLLTYNKDELRRVVASNSSQIYDSYGQLRAIGDGKTGFELTRVFGDNKSFQMCREPSITVYDNVESKFSYLLIFSDGITDVMNYSMIRKVIDYNKFDKIPKMMIVESLKRGSTDNITCLAVNVTELENTGKMYHLDNLKDELSVNEHEQLNEMYKVLIKLYPEKFQLVDY